MAGSISSTAARELLAKYLHGNLAGNICHLIYWNVI
jgi:hypothetical protein